MSTAIPFFFTVEDETETVRLDVFLADQPDFPSRSQLKQLLVDMQINNKPVKLSAQVSPGDIVSGKLLQPLEYSYAPEPLSAEILYEDQDVLVVNKPAGLVVHPAQGNPSGTLLNGLLGHVADLKDRFHEDAAEVEPHMAARPGIVHRLDKDTSGVIITAKHPAAHTFLAQQFADRKVGKLYLAVVKGVPRQTSGVLESRILRDPKNRKSYTAKEGGSTGKPAITSYQTVLTETIDGSVRSLVAMYPMTGRRHQLRVHMQWSGCPMVGDPVYSRTDSEDRERGMLLHAALLRIRLPGDTKRTPNFFAPLPEYWPGQMGLSRINDVNNGEVALPAGMDWCVAQLQLLMEDRGQER